VGHDGLGLAVERGFEHHLVSGVAELGTIRKVEKWIRAFSVKLAR
jgi:hypothetical protein